MSSRSKPSGTCIFCGNHGNLSKQHILPDRIKRLVPRKGNRHRNLLTRTYGVAGSLITPPPILKVRNGAFGTRQLRIVCKKCNQGWMNEVEQKAFLVLTPLILGQTAILTQENQSDIALFCALLAVMCDLDDVETSGISSTERTLIYETRAVPTNWYVMIGRMISEDWSLRLRHHGASLSGLEVPFVSPDVYNSQVTTVGIGRLLVQVISAQGYKLFRDPFDWPESVGLAPIHPFKREIAWNFVPCLSTKGVENVAEAFADLARSLPVPADSSNIA